MSRQLNQRPPGVGVSNPGHPKSATSPSPVAKLKRPGASSPRTKRRSSPRADILIFAESWWPQLVAASQRHVFLPEHDSGWSCDIQHLASPVDHLFIWPWFKMIYPPKNGWFPPIFWGVPVPWWYPNSWMVKVRMLPKPPARQLTQSCAKLRRLPFSCSQSLGQWRYLKIWVRIGHRPARSG